MVNGLACPCIHIENSAVALLVDLELLSQFLGNLKHVSDERIMFRQKIV
jgi:hypothetical protein